MICLAEMNSQNLPVDDVTTPGQSLNGNGTLLEDLLAEETYRGSIQQILSENTGKRVVVDFLVGSSNIVRKEGILYMVGVSYIVLYDDRNGTYTVCNLYSIEFTTFLPSNSNNQISRTTLKRV